MRISKPRQLALILVSVFSLLVLPLTGYSFNNSDSETELSPNKEQRLTSIEILSALKSNHYSYVDINDDFSKKLLKAYLKDLDPSKSYLLKSDIDEFQQYQNVLDDALEKANLTPAFTIFNRYQQRVRARLNWLLAQLDKGIEQFDFTIEEDFKPLKKDAKWSTTSAQLDEQWRKRLKNNVLDLRLTDKADDEIIKLLKERFEHQLERLDRIKSNDAFDVYMNTITSTYDPHTNYLAPLQSDNFTISMSRSLEGIGAVLQYDQEYTKVVRLVTGGPADIEGNLHPADRIVGVGEGTEGEIVNVIGWRLDEVVN